MEVKPTHKDFMKWVEKFEMKVLKDDGVYRHLAFRNPKKFSGSFDIVTWPGHLSFSGDMGDYTFERHYDMFTFFRRNKAEDTGINPGYWSEKLQAIDKRCGYKEFSREVFESKLKHDFDTYWEFDNESQRNRAWKEIKSELLDRFESEESSLNAAYNYECELTGQTFINFWEYDLNEYTFHFIWCCRAIPWAINEYDMSKNA